MYGTDHGRYLRDTYQMYLDGYDTKEDDRPALCWTDWLRIHGPAQINDGLANGEITIDHQREKHRSYEVQREIGAEGYAVTLRGIRASDGSMIPPGTTCAVRTGNGGFRGIDAWITAPNGAKAMVSLGALDAVPF
jgi:hypothetical protein